MVKRVQGMVTSRGRGLEAVVCSDGRTAVRTGADGAFDLEVSGPFVFICTPTGYRADPWYLPGDAELHFELEPQPQPVPFSFVHITDLHLAFDRWVLDEAVAATPEATERTMQEVARRHPDAAFVVSSGDQTNNGTDEEFRAYLDVAARSPVRIVAIPGNHDHNSVDLDLARRDGERFGPGVFVTPYDRFMGPRWFSFDHGGVHFVAVDWTTHHLGLERDVQEAWIRADLAYVARTTPIVFLTHDLMSTDFFGRVGAEPVASFSGHWHTSRVVVAGRALHVNTAPATFGGLDYAASHWRVATWDGEAMSIATFHPDAAEARATASVPTVWTAALAGTAHRAGPVVAGDLVIAVASNEDRPAGSVEAFDAAGGAARWRVALSSAMKTSPLVVGDRVVATAVTGETVCVDLDTGAELWRAEIDDPLRLWTYLRPATDGRLVFVGDTARFVALDLADGNVVWSRDDLGSRGNITCHSHPVVVDGVLVVSFAAQVPDMWALDSATGATIWPKDVTGASIYDLGADAMATQLPRTPVSAFGRDPDEADVYVVRLANVIDRIRVADGSVVWSSVVAGWFNPAAPVADGDDVYVCEGRGTVRCLSRDSGEARWTTAVTDSAPLHMGPYRNAGGALFGEPALTREHAIVACGDGRVAMLARTDGSLEREWIFGTPFAAPPAVRDGMCYVLGVDGVLRALKLD